MVSTDLVSCMQSETALTWPMQTGLTVSRWEGLGRIERRMFWLLIYFWTVTPRWYFTSPELPQFISSTRSVFSWNYAKIFCRGLLNTLCRALSLPLWAIPNPMYFTPCPAAVSTSLSA